MFIFLFTKTDEFREQSNEFKKVPSVKHIVILIRESTTPPLYKSFNFFFIIFATPFLRNI